MANFLFWPLAYAAMLCLALDLGASPASARLVAALYLLVPTQLAQAPTLYVDAAFAASTLATYAIMVRGFKKLTSRQKPSWLLEVALGMAIGLMIGVKGSGALVVAPGVVLYGVLRWRAVHYRFKPSVVFVVLVLLPILLVGGYWYARNTVHTGSPLYPIGIRIGETVIFPGISGSEAIREQPNTPPDYLALSPIWRTALSWVHGFARWPLDDTCALESRHGGLGLLWLLVCIPAICWRLRHEIRRPVEPEFVAWLFLLGVVGVAFCLSPMNWWARYTLWIYAAGLPALAFLLDRIMQRRCLLLAFSFWVLVVLCETAAACRSTGIFSPLKSYISL